jgi:FkbM family methyltransferase
MSWSSRALTGVRRFLLGSIEDQLRGIRLSLDDTARDARLIADDVGTSRHEVRKIDARVAALGDDVHGLRDELRQITERVAILTNTVETNRASSWGRFDELEIKVRPLIAFDQDSYAVRLMDGYAMIPRNEPIFTVMVVNAGSGGLEAGTRRVLKALIEPGMGVADVGANVGLLTLSCATSVGPSGRVHAFEPDDGPRAHLAKTLKLNGLHWVDVHACAVGAENGRRRFHVSPIIGHSSLYPLPVDEIDASRDIEVVVARLDDVIAPGHRLDVVKIDVEGAELDVLDGMSRLRAENPDMAVIAEFGPSHLERVGVTTETWLAAFFAAGLEAYVIEEPFGGCRPLSEVDLSEVVSVNLVFVRPGGAACARLPIVRSS